MVKIIRAVLSNLIQTVGSFEKFGKILKTKEASLKPLGQVFQLFLALGGLEEGLAPELQKVPVHLGLLLRNGARLTLVLPLFHSCGRLSLDRFQFFGTGG
jgi:hypothetical protein